MRDSFSFLDALESDLAHLDSGAIDLKYRQLAEQAVGTEVADAIARLPADADREALRAGLEDALGRAQRSGAIVVHCEYDLAHQWATWFFIGHEYATADEDDESWVQEYADEVRGPTLDDFASVHHAHGAFADTPRFAATLYLVARLAVTLRDLVTTSPHPLIGVCLGYHKQEPVWRLREPRL